MMIRQFLLSILPAVLVQPAMAADKVVTPENPLELKPDKDWTFTQRPQSCVMSRQFSDGEHKVLLQMEDYSLGDGFQLSLASANFTATRKEPWVAFIPEGILEEQPFAAISRLADGRTLLEFHGSTLLGVPREDKIDLDDPAALARLAADARERERHVSKFVIARALNRDLILDTGTMRAPLIVMRMCTAELARAHGVDPVAADAAVEKAHPADLQAWARKIQQNYPERMLKNHTQTVLPIRLTIDTEGNVSECFVLDAGQPAEFIKTACGITKDEKFVPAHDAQGNPVASFYNTRISYKLN